eukprot:4097129-Pyramimonas_sp.AAC.1
MHVRGARPRPCAISALVPTVCLCPHRHSALPLTALANMLILTSPHVRILAASRLREKSRDRLGIRRAAPAAASASTESACTIQTRA